MGIKSELLDAQTKAKKAGDSEEVARLQLLIDQVKKLRGDAAAGLGPGLDALFGPGAYTVGEGESPLSIAMKIFGFADLSTVKLMAEFNPDMFKVDNNGNVVFIGQPGDVLDLSFANAPGLVSAGDRFFQKGFTPGGTPIFGGGLNTETTGPEAPGSGPTSFTSESGIAPSTELRPGIDIPLPVPPPVAAGVTPGGVGTGSRAAREGTQAAFAAGEFTVVPPPSTTPTTPESQFNEAAAANAAASAAAFAAYDPAEGVGPLPIQGAFAAIGQIVGADLPTVGGDDAAAATAAGTETATVAGGGEAAGSERGTPFIGGIMGGTDEFTEFAKAFIEAIYQHSLNKEDRSMLPETVPGEVAAFVAPTYGSSKNDFSVTATSMMIGLEYRQDANGDWHRIDLELGGADEFKGYYGTYRNGISQSNRYHRLVKGRLAGPYTPRGGGGGGRGGGRGGGGGGRGGGGSGGYYPGMVIWNIRYPDL